MVTMKLVVRWLVKFVGEGLEPRSRHAALLSPHPSLKQVLEETWSILIRSCEQLWPFPHM